MIVVSFAILILTIALSAASLRSSRGDALGIPLVAIGSFTFLYVVQPITIMQTGAIGVFLTDWQIIKALILPAIMLAFFMWGWLSPVRERPRKSVFTWDARQMWRVGLAAAMVGLTLDLIFMQRSGGVTHALSQPHGRAMAWDGNTAYLYDGPWLMLSGSVMMILAGSRFKTLGWTRYLPFGFLTIFLVGHAVLSGSRGPLFSVVTAFFVASSIAKRRIVPLNRSVGLLLVLGCGVLVMVGYRDFLHLGEQKHATLPTVTSVFDGVASVSDYDQGHNTSGQEFILHAVVIDTVDQTGKFDYGLSWMEYLVINPIPKLLWPGKHYPDTPGITGADIHEHANISFSPGAAPGIVADLYGKFGVFTALFLYAFGRVIRRMFVSATRLESPASAVAYVMLFALSLNIFAQGFGAFFVTFGYSMLPVMWFTWSGRRRQQRVWQQRRTISPRHSAQVAS